MDGWMIFGIIIIIIFIAIQYWHVTLGIIALGLFIYLIYRLDEAQKRKDEAEEARIQEENARRRQEEYQIQQYKANQEYVLQCVERTISDSYSIFQRLPGELVSAEKALDKAERKFAGNYYAPFWEAIDHAVNHLGAFCLGIQQIENHHRNYKEQRKNLDSRPPSFPAFNFPDALGTANCMQRIVRPAQRNIHFATIYEQRRTNQLLIMGFTSLAQAIDGMGSRINSSINDLSRSMSGED